MMLPLRMLPDGTDWVPAWRLKAAADALEALLSITPKWKPYSGGDAARMRQVARYIAIRDEAEAALGRLRGDR